MKRALFITLFLSVLFFKAYTQEYGFYYKTSNYADNLFFNRNYQQALDTYEKAFKSVPYIHSERLMNACTCAVKAGEFKRAYDFAKRSIINSGKSFIMVRLKRNKFRKFRDTPYFKNLKDSLELFKNRNSLQINVEYKALIDSLLYVDQNIIRKNKSVKGNYKIDLASLPEDKFKLDSSNFKKLLELINQYGFPSEELLGFDGYSNASTIIHHCFRKKENEKYHHIIFEAINKGWYMPRNFSFWYEQFNMWHKNQTYFTTNDKDTSKSNLDRINSNRAKFFLKEI